MNFQLPKSPITTSDQWAHRKLVNAQFKEFLGLLFIIGLMFFIANHS
jgi:hypothetical protein